MGELRQYIVSVIVISVVAAILNKLMDNSKTKKFVRMVTGLILSVVFLSPLSRFNITSYILDFESVEREADNAVAYGDKIYQDNLDAIIRQRCETYILDKAKRLGANINVMIECDDSQIPIPVHAQITGTVSPYVRKTLQNIISDEIGIPEEEQIWT